MDMHRFSIWSLQNQPKSSNFAFRFSIWTEIPAKKWKNTQKVGPEIDRERRKTITVFAFTTAVCAPKSAPFNRWNIKHFTSRQSVGETKFWHFSCFQKRHFSRFASNSGPKMPPERDSWRPEFPKVSASEAPFGAQKNDEREGISFLQKRLRASIWDFRDFLRVCVRVSAFRRPRGGRL